MFSDEEFIKEYLVDSAWLISPEIKEVFENMQIVTRQIKDTVKNVRL